MVETVCRACGKTFLVKPSWYSTRVTCTRKCMAEYFKSAMRGTKNPNFRNASEKTCSRCGSTYHSYNHRSKFCSIKCRHEPKPLNPISPKRQCRIWKCQRCGEVLPRRRKFCQAHRFIRNTCLLNCKMCGKEFQDYKHKKFCSRECYIKTVGPRQRGDKSHLWRGGVSPAEKIIRESAEYALWRSNVFKRDDWTCQICRKRGGILTAHHIKEFLKYPELRMELANGITLCWDCHSSIRWKESQFVVAFQLIVSKRTSLDPRLKITDTSGD